MQITVADSEFPDRGSGRKGTLQPVYTVGGKITQTWMRKTMVQALTQFGAMIDEVLPYALVEQYHFMPRQQAIALIHHPQNTEDGHRARNRMVYEELFMFQLKLQAFRTLTRERMDADGADGDSC